MFCSCYDKAGRRKKEKRKKKKKKSWSAGALVYVLAHKSGTKRQLTKVPSRANK